MGRREERRDEKRRNLNEKKRMLKNADISVKNNSIALVILKSEFGGSSLFEINPRETEDISFEDLQSIVKRQRKMFEKYFVLITEVYSDEHEDLTVNDVYMALGLNSLIKDENNDELPDDFYFDDLLSNDCPLDEFREEIEEMDVQVACRLAERAVYLYKERKFADSIKVGLIEDKIGEDHLFEDADKSEKEIKSDVEEF